MRYAAMLLGIVSLLLTRSVAAGSLKPPSLPPPTMKRCAEIEPRTPIHAADLPMTITTPGSYYLVENAQSASATITIVVDHVTIDLSGFTLGSTTTPFAITGGNYVSIRNGHLVGVSPSVNLSLGSHGSLDQLAVSGSGVSIGDWGQVSRCSVDAGGPSVLSCGAYCIVQDTQLSATIGGGVDVGRNGLLERVEISNMDGLSVGSGSIVSRCSMTLMDVGLSARSTFVSVIDSTILCTGDGCIHLGDDAQLINTHVGGGATYGVLLGDRSRVQSVSVSKGVTVGDGSTVKDSLLGGGGSIGSLTLGSDSTVVGNTCTNGGTGILVNGSGNRIEGNSLLQNNVGLLVNGTGNTVLRNTASKNSGGNYQIASGNDVGPITTAAAATSPWANISY